MLCKFLNVFFASIAFACMFSCTYYADGLPVPPTDKKDTTQTDKCQTASITYTNYVKSILDASCNSTYCHGGSAPGNFTGYTGLKASVDNGSFKKRVIDGVPSFMPPGNPLPMQKRDSLVLWINQGACE